MPKKSKLPKLSVNRILKIQSKLINETLVDDVGFTFTGIALEDLVTRIVEAIPVKVKEDTILYSITDIVGVLTTKESLELLSWRIAGNLDQLAEDVAVPMWLSQHKEEWVATVVRSVLPATKWVIDKENKKKSIQGAYLKFFVLSGSAAGRTIIKFWSNKFAAYKKSVFGFSKYDLKRYQYQVSSKRVNVPFHNIVELGNLRVFVKLSPDNSGITSPIPSFVNNDLACSSAMLKHNKDILKLRNRIKFKCPFELSVACYECIAGTDRCVAGCRKITQVVKLCHLCNSEKPFDTDDDTVCVDCSHVYEGDR